MAEILEVQPSPEVVTIYDSVGLPGVDGTDADMTAVNAAIAAALVTLKASANSWTNAQTITSPAAGTVPLTAKGAASQSANLTEWQNSAGSVRARVGPDGQGRFAGLDVGSAANDYAGLPTSTRLAVVTGQTNLVGIAVRGIAAQGSDLQQWQLDGGTVVSRINSAGNLLSTGTVEPRVLRLKNGTSALTGSQLSVEVESAAVVGQVIRGAASQTADLTQWQDSAGAVQASVSAAGLLQAKRVAVVGTDAGSIAAVVQGAAAQTADLQRWQNSAGTVLSFVDAVGGFRAPYIQGLTGLGPAMTTDATTIRFGPLNVAHVPITARGMAGQTGDLQQWQNIAGGVLSRVNSAGQLLSPGGIYAGSASATGAFLGVTNPAGAEGTVTVRFTGAAAQTADLTRWQDGTGTTIAKVAADGQVSITTSAGFRLVEVGAADSGGTGYRALRVLN